MKGTNTIEINQATMLEAMDLWLADQFKSPPKARSVSEVRSGGHMDGFKVELESPITSEENPDG